MKRLKLLKELGRYPVFSSKIVENVSKQKKEYAKLIIYRLKKAGLITELEKGKYTLHEDPLVVASHIVWPCYISCWAAIRYYNLTEQLPRVISIITTRQRKNKSLKFGPTKIIFVKVTPKNFFGFQKKRYKDFDIFIAEPEKALIDSAMLKKISFSELVDIVKEHIKKIDVNRLIVYLLRIKNKTIAKRFGWLLDSLGIDRYAKLKRLVDARYVLVDYAIRQRGKMNKRWKVIENVKF